MQNFVPDVKSNNSSITRREEYSEATKQALLGAAREQFTTAGYQETSVEAIARAARVTRGAFYHHFEDKRALFETLVLALQIEAAARLVAAGKSQPDLSSRIQAGIMAYLTICSERSYRRIVIQEAPAVLGVTRCREIADAHVFGLFIGALGELRKAGKFDFENTHLAGHMIGAMICEAAQLLPGSTEEGELKRDAGALMLRVLAALGVNHNSRLKIKHTSKRASRRN
jgi:AcrR family transcriptional regulator